MGNKLGVEDEGFSKADETSLRLLAAHALVRLLAPPTPWPVCCVFRVLCRLCALSALVCVLCVWCASLPAGCKRQVARRDETRGRWCVEMARRGDARGRWRVEMSAMRSDMALLDGADAE